MNNDRELLELAAKAAGMRVEQGYGQPPENCLFYVDKDGGCYDWNPLLDDGDALRLAVNLNIGIEVWKGQAWVWKDGDKNEPVAIECVCNDPYSATRRAIVRAAAEIGRLK